LDAEFLVILEATPPPKTGCSSAVRLRSVRAAVCFAAALDRMALEE
jgi:hypothetical protein